MQLLPHSVRKISKKLSKRLSKLQAKLQSGKNPIIVVTFGIFLFLVGASHYYQLRILSFRGYVAKAENMQIGELPVQITIPSIGIDQKIEVGSIIEGVWQISYEHPTFLDSSARPGTGGNTVIYGHNKKVIFGNLPYVSIGQNVFIKVMSGKIYKYEIYQKDFVGPGRVDLVSPTNKEELTLYTCYGLFDSQRAVIKARPLKDSP